jgi:hypothetical protein
LVSAYAQSAQEKTALVLHEQGRVALARADYSQAERLFGDSLAIWRNLGSPYEAHAASTLLMMGDALSYAGKWREGTNALEDALRLNRRSLGPKQIRTVYNLNSLCHAYQFVDELRRAEAACTEALEIERELYAKNVLLGQTLLGLSLLRRRQARLDEALAAGEESLRASIESRGEASVDAGAAYENIAALHLAVGHPLRAIPLFRKARFIYEQSLGAGSPLLASVISQEGLALLEDGQLRRAEINMSQAIERLIEIGPSAEYRLAVAETNLGMLRLRQKKLAESERLLVHALAIQDRLPAAASYNLAATARALAQLRKLQHRDTESAELMGRATVVRSVP